MSATRQQGDLRGKVCLVTGATSGVGRSLAASLAGLAARVVILARDAGLGGAAADAIRRSAGLRPEVLVCDLADLRSVNRAADAFRGRWDRLDVLAHVAGIVAWKRLLSADGYELTFATNLLGPALLTSRLVDLLERSAPARVVAVSGGLSTLEHARLDLERLKQRSGRFGAFKTAVGVMLARVVYFMELARRLDGSGVTVNAFYPGLVRSRLDRGLPLPLRLAARLAQPFLKSGSAAALRSVADPDLAGISGAFLAGRRVLSFRNCHVTLDESQRLWSLIEQLIETVPASPRA